MKTRSHSKQKSSKGMTRGKTFSAAAKVIRRKTNRAKSAAGQLLSPKPSQGSFNVKTFCTRYKVVRPDLTRMTGYSLRSVDKWAAGEKPSAVTQRRLMEMQRLFIELSKIMEPGYVGEWLKTTNDAFDGSTPLQVIERGETDRIWRMIFIVETGESL